MRFVIAIILGMMLLPGLGMAQQDDIMSASSSLQQVLSTLQDSVQRLSADNDQWMARDNDIKTQVSQLQMQLGHLEAQNDLLNKTAGQLQDKNPRLTQRIERLEEENMDLDNRAEKAHEGIKLIRQSLNTGYQEDQQLLQQINAVSQPLPPPPPKVESPEFQAQDRRQKERLKLMKMIYESQQRQVGLHKSILAFQQNAPLQPAAGALAQQQLLKEQINGMEGQIAALPPEPSVNAGPANQWDETQLHELEEESKSLEQNYAQLKVLTEQMSQKAQGVRMSVSQQVEEEKLQSSLDELKHQGKGLMVDLDDLRSQMVDLDKRKSRLEMMVQHLS